MSQQHGSSRNTANSWQISIESYSRSGSSCTWHAYSEVYVGDNELTAVRRVPVTAICIHSESLTAAKPVKHSVVKRVRVFDMHTSHLISGLVLSDIIDVAGSTSPERSSNICCVVYHLIEQCESVKCSWWLLSKQVDFVSYQCSGDGRPVLSRMEICDLVRIAVGGI